MRLSVKVLHCHLVPSHIACSVHWRIVLGEKVVTTHHWEDKRIRKDFSYHFIDLLDRFYVHVIVKLAGLFCDYIASYDDEAWRLVIDRLEFQSELFQHSSGAIYRHVTATMTKWVSDVFFIYLPENLSIRIVYITTTEGAAICA